MNLSQIAPLETIAAEGLTGLIISTTSKGDGAKITKRAGAVLAIAQAVQQIVAGQSVTGMSALTQALATQDLDPGEALAVQGLFTQMGNQAALLNAVGGNLPTAQIAMQVFNNICTGVTNACTAELNKYSKSATAQPAVASAAKPG